ncbi:MAG: DUF5828 family protein [Candidatus Nanohaloarchaea archaeon]
MGDGPEETNSGVSMRGSWKDIADFARKVQRSFEESGVDDDKIQKYEEWRPREEGSEADVREKTVEEAKLDPNEVEEESDGVRKDIEDAGRKAREAGEKVKRMEKPSDEVREASRGLIRPLAASALKSFRKVEEKIYSLVMLRFNPYYFDSEDFSARIEERGQGYRMDVDVADDGLREEFKEDLRSGDLE